MPEAGRTAETAWVAAQQGQVEVATFQKSGQTPIEVSLRRTGVGIEVNVKTIPEVEDFMKQLGNGRTVAVESYGRAWVPKVKGQELRAYDLYDSFDTVNQYTIMAIGHPMKYEGYTNLSFLRLVGVSEGAGAGFVLKGVFSLPALRELKDSIAVASRQLFIDYLRPVEMVVKVSTQEVRL